MESNPSAVELIDGRPEPIERQRAAPAEGDPDAHLDHGPEC